MIVADFVTPKQFSYIRGLAAQRNWQSAPTTVSLAIKKVNRAKDWSTAEVLRKDASAAISFLLSPQAPAVVTTAPAKTVTAVNTVNVWQTLTASLAPLPISKYALPKIEDPSEYVFYEIVQRADGRRFLNRLQGAPGTWHRVFLPAAQQVTIAKRIAEDPTKHGTAYCAKFTRCCACDSPLSNAKSIAEAMGPVCRKKFKW